MHQSKCADFVAWSCGTLLSKQQGAATPRNEVCLYIIAVSSRIVSRLISTTAHCYEGELFTLIKLLLLFLTFVRTAKRQSRYKRISKIKGTLYLFVHCFGKKRLAYMARYIQCKVALCCKYCVNYNVLINIIMVQAASYGFKKLCNNKMSEATMLLTIVGGHYIILLTWYKRLASHVRKS